MVALTLTGAPSAAARLASISARCAPSRGASQITVASTLTTGPESSPSADPQQVERVGVAPALLVGREVGAEVAEPGGAEHRVDHGVGDDVGVGVALEPQVVLDLDPAEHQPPPGGEPVAVVADPDPRPAGHPSGSMRRSRCSKTQISSTPQPRIASTARSYS